MLDLLNKFMFYAKTILHIIVFCLSLYILLMMGDYAQIDILNIISVFIPMFLVLIIFVISFFFNEGNNNTFFNLANLLALLSIAIICFRTLFDKNMIYNLKDHINYYFFQNQVKQIKILSYMIFIGNAILIYQDKMKKKKS